MKKILAWILVVVMCFALVACEKQQENAEPTFKTGAYGRLGKFIYEKGEKDGAEYVYRSRDFSMHLALNGEITWKYTVDGERNGVSMTLLESDMQEVVYTDTMVVSDGSEVEVHSTGSIMKSTYDPDRPADSKVYGYITSDLVDDAYRDLGRLILEERTKILVEKAKDVVEEAGLTMADFGFKAF